MKKPEQTVEQSLGLNKVDYTELAHLVYKKDYTAQALSFISNHSRTLNYWSEGEHDLLPSPPPREGTRRRYSFLDLVWLGIVKELRDFGLEKEAIYKVKKSLLHTNNAKSLLEILDQHPKEFEAELIRSTGVNAVQAKELMESFQLKKDVLESMEDCHLLSRILSVISIGLPLYMLFTKDGHGAEYIEGNLETELQINEPLRKVYRSPHISIFLNSIVSNFLTKEYISDRLRNVVFTESEVAMIREVREKGVESIIIRFGSDERVETIEYSEPVKLQVEARLNEVIAKKGYSEITLKTLDGKILYAKRTQKNKP